MDKKYKAKEIIEMSIQAKTRSIELYLTLARNSENYHVGKLFTELAKSGQKSKLQLEKLLSSSNTIMDMEAYPGERTLYLKFVVDNNTFICDKTCKKTLEKTISEEEALQAGITFKKDFMLFLHELKSETTEDGKKTIDSIIEDEIDSLKLLFHLKEKIDGK